MARKEEKPVLARACRAFVIYGVIYSFVALAMDLPARFESLARLQPMRNLHLLYLFLFVVMGGFLAEHILKNRAWRWLALFLPLSIGMFMAQRSLFPVAWTHARKVYHQSKGVSKTTAPRGTFNHQTAAGPARNCDWRFGYSLVDGSKPEVCCA